MRELLTLAVVVFGYALVSHRVERLAVTGPMVMVAVGLVIGDGGLGWLELELETESVSLLAEATLVLVLFSDATRIDLRRLRANFGIPARMLGIGLPMTVALGTVAAVVLLDGLRFWEAALLAAILAPTDAALGAAVVTDHRLPVRIRQSVNVESGLNDGLAVPVVTVMLALAAAEEEGDTAEWVEFIARQIGFGLVIGVAAGYAGGLLLDHFVSRGWVDGALRQISTLAIAVAAFAGAEQIEGNGFVAAFVAGLTFGAVARAHCPHVQDFVEDEGELLTLLTFLVFGAVIAGPRLDELTWQIALYAALSLTVVRMLPVAVSLMGAGLHRETVAFFGWFGPRGLASVVFGILVIEEVDLTGGDLVFGVMAWTVLASVFLHGVTARPWAAGLAARLDSMVDDEPEMAEMAEMPDLPPRRRSGPGSPAGAVDRENPPGAAGSE